MNLLPTATPVLPMEDSLISMGDESMTGLEPEPDESQTSSQSGCETPKRKKNLELGRLVTDNANLHTSPADLIEYEWPLNSGDKYFLQEQIAEMLDVKSFKRKYPNIPRRTIEGSERQYLFKELEIGKVIPLHLQNLLTALESDAVLNLLAAEYVEYFTEYQRVLLERRQKELIQRQTDVKMIQVDATKLAELRKQALKNASEVNEHMQNCRRNERRHFFDVQTFTMQCPKNKTKRLPKEFTRVSPYPVALVQSQFQEYYKKFEPEQLNRLPLNTIMDSSHLLYPAKEPSPLPIHVSEDEIRKMQPPPKQEVPETPTTKSARLANKRLERNLLRLCNRCNSSQESEDPLYRMLKCTHCQAFSHPKCAEMTVEMVRVVKTYPWCCIDCKTCNVCNKPDEEASMMCCDLCDRGYHTFCVGLNKPPSGNWLCAICRNSKK
ncbi:unnamed protein product [Bursaphelenchus xylophilus]|uniref:(pine wood nematode) hypothetical protein n=1 Tax=Bursaphelenchus xylophilus TaxID=6326 RepID=A0A7I8XGG8_BURXY|nr:unnamed protein product [Bursaphelenchus xylophilus]CAG9124378.1 unnamed protein product [Bursaphelenchus xylophilus]